MQCSLLYLTLLCAPLKHKVNWRTWHTCCASLQILSCDWTFTVQGAVSSKRSNLHPLCYSLSDYGIKPWIVMWLQVILFFSDVSSEYRFMLPSERSATETDQNYVTVHSGCDVDPCGSTHIVPSYTIIIRVSCDPNVACRSDMRRLQACQCLLTEYTLQTRFFILFMHICRTNLTFRSLFIQ